MAKKSEIGRGGIRPLGKDDEMIIDIRKDGTVCCPWLTTEGDEILKSVGKTPERFERISDYCG